MNSKFKIAYILIIAITCTCSFSRLSSGLSPLPGSQNPLVKRKILAALNKNLVRYPQTQTEVELLKQNNTNCIFLSSGYFLISRLTDIDDVTFLRAIIREQVKALVQILLWEYRNNINDKYLLLKTITLQNFKTSAVSEPDKDIFVINIIARAFEWLSLLEDNIITKDEIPEHIKLFLAKAGPVINSSKHYIFTEEFWDSTVRSERIRKAVNKGIHFYDVGLFPAQIAYKEIENTVAEIKHNAFIGEPEGEPEEYAKNQIENLQDKLTAYGPEITFYLISELARLFREVNTDGIRNFHYHYARKAIIEVITRFRDEESMMVLKEFFRWLEINYPQYRYYDYIINEIGRSESAYIYYFSDFCVDYLYNHASAEGVIFRTNARIDPTIDFLDKCGDPRGFLWKLKICSNMHEDTDNTAVFVIKVNKDGSIQTKTFPGLVKHQGGNVENYRGETLLSDDTSGYFRGTLHGSTKKRICADKKSDNKVFLRIDPPSGNLTDANAEDLIRILRILSHEIHPEMPLVLVEKVKRKIEDYFEITFPESETLTLSTMLFSIDNLQANNDTLMKTSYRSENFHSLRSEGTTVYADVPINLEKGLHLTPIIGIAKLLKNFPKTKVTYRKKNQTADATNILDSQMLACGPGEIVEVRVDGPRAHDIMAIIVGILSEAEKNKKIFRQITETFPVSRKERKKIKKYVKFHPEILDYKVLSELSRKLSLLIFSDKWPWQRIKTGKRTFYSLPVKSVSGKYSKHDVQRQADRSGELLQDYLDIINSPSLMNVNSFRKDIIVELIKRSISTNMDISIENMTVFGITMNLNLSLPLKFASKPSRFYTHIPGQEEHPVLYDGFLEEDPGKIRGTIAQSIESPEGFVRLDPSFYTDYLFIATQVQQTVCFLIETGVNPLKKLVFPERTKKILNNMLDIKLPEEITLGEFRDITDSPDHILKKPQFNRKKYSSICGLPLRQKIDIHIERGIHNKTAIHIVEIAKYFSAAKLFIRQGNKIASAFDRVDLVGLGIGQNETVEILGGGPGAHTAIQMIIDFLNVGKTAKKNEIVIRLPEIFKKWTKRGIRLFRGLHETHDIKSTKVLSIDLLYSAFEENKTYTIKYDQARLSSGQIALVKSYVDFLKEKSAHPGNFKLIPFSSKHIDSETGDKQCSLFTVVCEGPGHHGESQIFVKTEEGRLDEHILRIPGFLNISIAAATIPDNVSQSAIPKSYAAIFAFIKAQCILIIGEENFSGNILSDIRNVRITLPKIYRHVDTDAIDTYNRETHNILTMS